MNIRRCWTFHHEAGSQELGQGWNGVSFARRTNLTYRSYEMLSFWYKLSSRSIGLIPEESEDMWHAYNLIAEGDNVTSSTFRKVQTESATGSSTSSKVRTVLKISVENIDFDTQACALRLKGRNVQDNQYVKVSILLSHVIDPSGYHSKILYS